MKMKLYTIEYGYIQEDDELYCTNEKNFIDEQKYITALTEILSSAVNNFSQQGFYVECYLDEEDLDEQDIEDIENWDAYNDSPMKCNMIQNFIIKNNLKGE